MHNLCLQPKITFMKKLRVKHTPLEAQAMLETAHFYIGLHAKYCSVAFKYLSIMHAANTACCIALLAGNAAGCMPHAIFL